MEIKTVTSIETSFKASGSDRSFSIKGSDKDGFTFSEHWIGSGRTELFKIYKDEIDGFVEEFTKIQNAIKPKTN